MTNKPFRLHSGFVNFAKFLFYHPCSNPFFVAVETFIPCFVKMAITIATMDIFDIAQEQIKAYPRGGKGGPTRGRAHERSAATEEERSAKKPRFQAAAFEEKRWVQGLTHVIQTVSVPLQEIGFFFLIYGSVDQFFYDWTSLLAKRDYCSARPTSGPYQAHDQNSGCLFSMGGTPLTIRFVDINRSAWPATGEGVLLPVGRYGVVLTVTAISTGSPGPNAFLRVTVDKGGLIHQVYDGPKQRMIANQEMQFVCTAIVDLELFVSSQMGWYTVSDDAPVGAATLVSASVAVYQLDWFQGFDA